MGSSGFWCFFCWQKDRVMVTFAFGLIGNGRNGKSRAKWSPSSWEQVAFCVAFKYKKIE